MRISKIGPERMMTTAMDRQARLDTLPRLGLMDKIPHCTSHYSKAEDMVCRKADTHQSKASETTDTLHSQHILQAIPLVTALLLVWQ